MTSDQISQLLNFLILLSAAIWRMYSASRKNTPATTQTRLTNGYASGKLDTDEWRIVRERELLADRNRDEQMIEFGRWRLHTETRLYEMERNMQQQLVLSGQINARLAGIEHALSLLSVGKPEATP